MWEYLSTYEQVQFVGNKLVYVYQLQRKAYNSKFESESFFIFRGILHSDCHIALFFYSYVLKVNLPNNGRRVSSWVDVPPNKEQNDDLPGKAM